MLIVYVSQKIVVYNSVIRVFNFFFVYLKTYMFSYNDNRTDTGELVSVGSIYNCLNGVLKFDIWFYFNNFNFNLHV